MCVDPSCLVLMVMYVHTYVYRSMQESSTLKSWSATFFTKSVDIPIVRCTVTLLHHVLLDWIETE